jgi:predicted acyl esterase
MDSSPSSAQPHRFLVIRTPFGVVPCGETDYRRQLGPSESFNRAGYIFVFQDVRGGYQSEAQFVEMRPHIAPHPSTPTKAPTCPTQSTGS